LEDFSFDGDLSVDSSELIVQRDQVQIPFLRYVTVEGKSLKIDTLVWLLKNCPSLQSLTIDEGLDMTSKDSNTPKGSSIALDSTSFRANIRDLDFKHTFDSDKDPEWLPLFGTVFKNLTELQISIYGNNPAADRFFTHLFKVCLYLKILTVYSPHFTTSHLKSLQKPNLPPQLKATINLKDTPDNFP